MKLRILASAAALGLLAAPASAANTASDGVLISGSQDAVCVLTGTPADVLLGALDAPLGDAKAVVITNTTIKYGDSYCNKAHTIELKSTNGGLTNGTALPTGSDLFAARVDYTASIAAADWGAAVELVTDGTANQFKSEPVGNAFRNDALSSGGLDSEGLLVTIKTIANATDPLLQGTYSDTLTLTLTAS